MDTLALGKVEESSRRPSTSGSLASSVEHGKTKTLQALIDSQDKIKNLEVRKKRNFKQNFK